MALLRFRINARVKRAGLSFVLALTTVSLALSGQHPAIASDSDKDSNHRLLAAGVATDAQLKSAWALYNQHLYAASAQAFESLLAKCAPSARLYYYAALANRDAGNGARSRQLFQHLVAHYPTTPEGKYAQQCAAAAAPAAPAAASSDDTGLPDLVKNALPPEVRAMLGTEQGKAALKTVMAQQAGNLAIVNQAAAKGILNKENTQAAAKNVLKAPPPRKPVGDHPFTPEDIARDGAHGIDQSRYPNCWFEASMSALAQLPRGQKLISSMIKTGEKNGYVVRFPNDGVEYKITQEDLDKSGIHDKCQWASILECAEISKFPNNAGAEGVTGDQSRLEVGLGCITGCKAEVILPANVSTGDLSSFIGGAVKSQNPIVAGTWNYAHIASLPQLIVPTHAYTIIDFDPSKSMITIRNPHGQHGDLFDLESDPRHEQFEQLDDGVFKMNLDLFQKYFYSIARSFI
jgi:hypothetical protein